MNSAIPQSRPIEATQDGGIDAQFHELTAPNSPLLLLLRFCLVQIQQQNIRLRILGLELGTSIAGTARDQFMEEGRVRRGMAGPLGTTRVDAENGGSVEKR